MRNAIPRNHLKLNHTCAPSALIYGSVAIVVTKCYPAGNNKAIVAPFSTNYRQLKLNTLHYFPEYINAGPLVLFLPESR